MPQEMQTTAWLETEKGDKIPLQGLCTIGRGESNHIILNTSAMSRHHAVIHERDKEFWMVDLGSINGLQVNGRRVGQPVRLQAGDQIQLPSALFIFRQGTELITLPAQSDDRQVVTPALKPKPELIVADSELTQPLPMVSTAKVESPLEETKVTQVSPSITVPPEEKKDTPPTALPIATPVVTSTEETKELSPTAPVEVEAKTTHLRGRKKRRAAWKEKVAASPEEKPVEPQSKASPVVASSDEKKDLLLATATKALPLVDSPEEKKELPQATKSGSLIDTPEEKVGTVPAKPAKALRVFVAPVDAKEAPSISAATAPPASNQQAAPITAPQAAPVTVISQETNKALLAAALAPTVVQSVVEVKKESLPIAEMLPKPTPPALPRVNEPVAETKPDSAVAKPEEKKGPSHTAITKLSTVAVKPDEKMEALLAASASPATELESPEAKPASLDPVQPVPALTPATVIEPKPEPMAGRINGQSELVLVSEELPINKQAEAKEGAPAPATPPALLSEPLVEKKQPPPLIEAKSVVVPPPLEEKKEAPILTTVPHTALPSAIAVTMPPLPVTNPDPAPAKSKGKQKSRQPAATERATSDRIKPTKMCRMAQQSMYIGLASIFLPFIGMITAVVAVVLGHKAIRIIRRSKGELAGKESAVMGLYFGYITMGIILVYSTVFVFLYSTPSESDFAATQEAIPVNLGPAPVKRQGLAPSMLTPGGQKTLPVPMPVAVASRPNPPAPPPASVIPSSQNGPSVLAPAPATKSPELPAPAPIAKIPPAPEPANNEAVELPPANVPPVIAQITTLDKNGPKPPSPEVEKPAASEDSTVVFSYDQQLKLKDEMLALPLPNESVDSPGYMDAEAFNNAARILARKPEQKYADSVEDFLDGVKERNPDQARLKILSKMFEGYRAGLSTQ